MPLLRRYTDGRRVKPYTKADQAGKRDDRRRYDPRTTFTSVPKPMNVRSKKRQAYLASAEHDRAYSEREAYCVGHAVGAPGRCTGILTPHHTLPRSQAGGLERAEELAPVVTVCAWLNTWFQEDGREWAQTHTFVRGGVEYPFLVSLDADLP